MRVPQLTPGITAEIRNAVHHHVDLLPSESQDVLLVAALAGLEFSVRVVCAVCDRPAELVRELIESEVSAGVFGVISRERGLFRFSAPGFREVLMEELPPERRKWLLQKIGAASGGTA